MTIKTICVIGCNGFVGSHVTAELLAQGFSVHGGLRDTATDKTAWIKERIVPLAIDGATLTLFPFQAKNKESIKEAAKNCSGIICCAGSPLQKPETMELMEDLATNVSDAALELGIEVAVFTSSTGSTNPPEGEPLLKMEMEHWSDTITQIAAKKYAAAAKTKYDRIIMDKMESSDGRLRSVTINPSMIAGPCFQPEPVTSLRSFAAIIKGERMGDKVPNSSMSMIDVRDLAKMHVAALLNESTRGRYFGVKKSWHWREILQALSDAVPDCDPPKYDPNEKPVRPTQFDLTRRDSLGVKLRDLPDILKDVVVELKDRELI